MEEKKLTGYPSIDKPWLKYYTEENINVVIPKTSMYQFAWMSNCENLDECCLEYYGNKITYQEFFVNVRKTATAFYSMGIRKGDIVTIVSMHTPETLYAIYALNYIGAVANMLYMTVSEQEIINSVHKTESKSVMILDLATEKANHLASALSVPVIIMPMADSMPTLIRWMFSLKNKQPKTELQTFWQWIKSADSENEYPECTDSDAIAIIVYTSGTTGSPKGVMLTNGCLNATAVSCQQTGKNYKRGEKFLDSIPPFLGFGISMTHLGICLGFTTQIVLSPDPDEIAKTFIKLKSNRLVYGPRLTDAIIKHVKGNLDFLVEFTGGGEAISLEKERAINIFLNEHNSPTRYTSGYGMTESTSVICLNTNHAYKEGSAGIPLPTVNVKVMDGDIEQPYNEIGELCFDSPSVMQGYHKEPKATADVLEIDASGNRWLHTGDLGYVDEDGFVYVTGRLKRIYAVFGKDKNLYKLFPQRIEEFIAAMPGVMSCGVIVREDPEKAHIAIAFVVVNNPQKNNEAVISEIMDAIKQELPEHLRPESIHIIESMPLTASGKIDYRALEKEAAEML